MTDKEKIKAEIERLRDSIREYRMVDFDAGELSAYDKIISFIDTLEVKEVDLDEEINKHWDEWAKEDRFHSIDFAKHFFELGLEVQKGEEV